MSINTINIMYENKYLDMLKCIVLKNFSATDSRVFLFGSRAKNNFRKDSDYDIGVENIDKNSFLKIKCKIESIVEESIIPHSVDMVNFDETSEDFKKYALKDIILWKNGSCVLIISEKLIKFLMSLFITMKRVY